jgi:hypothetical protein
MIISFDRHHAGAVAQPVPGEFHNHAAAGENQRKTFAVSASFAPDTKKA